MSDKGEAASQCIPRATYRLQFHSGFPLHRGIELIPYLADLGVSHVYASPLLKACPGSVHGYDVCDHGKINPEIGTEQELGDFVTTLRRHGMGLVLDIVPNHMGICGRDNPWWWDVLKNGRHSHFADYFDIDWDAPDPRSRGKVLVPMLGDFYGRILERGELRLVHEHDEFLLAYLEHRFPIAPDTLTDSVGTIPESLTKFNEDIGALDGLIQKQHYRLTDWHHGDEALNYRRFFNIWSLAGIRVEDPRVFGAAHALILKWYSAGWIDGLRVDHPDGLHDPTEYFERLHAAAPRAWIIAEKILQPGETISEEWPVAGTTGYEFVRRVTGLFVDPKGEKPLTDFYAEFTGEATDYGWLVREKQRLVLRELLVAEVNWLTRILSRIAGRYWRYRDLSETDLREALIEITARLPVYCTYVQPHLGHVPEADEKLISDTIVESRNRRATIPPEAFDFLQELLLLKLRGDAEQEFVMRFQQITGPTMAKGSEDTACYCFNRLVALNMVGGDPRQFGISPQAFHTACVRSLQRWPNSMITTSTHDTKRSEDVQMRLCLLSEIPDEWQGAVRRWSALNDKHRSGGWPDRNAEYLYYQVLVGAWPLPVDRAVKFVEKAACEAKQHTSWNRREQVYENALREFVRRTLADAEFVADLQQFVTRLIEPGFVNSLAQLLLKLTAPGVPDIYQGNELWDFSLVDPDNRRPVDFDLRHELAAQAKDLSAETAWERMAQGVPKVWLIRRVLGLRREHPDWFGAESTYAPLAARGSKGDHAMGFVRANRIAIIVPRLVLGLGGNWDDTEVLLPVGSWRNELTGDLFEGGWSRIASCLRRFPVALLVRNQ